MRQLFLFLALLCMGFARGEAAPKNEPKIRVLLAKEARGVLLEARGGYTVCQKSNGKQITKGSTGKRFVAHALSNGLRWGEEYPDVYGISIQPSDENTCFYVDGMQYKGNIEILCTKKGFVNVVNEVAIEDYIKSTLALELTAPVSKEAGAAIAIAARTNAFATVFYRDKNSLWDVTAKDAKYLGLGVTMAKNGVDQAVALTEKIVLEDKNGKPMKGINLAPKDAEALAVRGLDAKRILRNVVPQTEISTTREIAQN